MTTPIQRSRGVPAATKAAFAMFDGRVLRKFFGLSPEDLDALEREADAALAVNLNRDEGSRST